MFRWHVWPWLIPSPSAGHADRSVPCRYRLGAKLLEGRGQPLSDVFGGAAFDLTTGNEVHKFTVAIQGQTGRRRRNGAEVLAGALRGFLVLAGGYGGDAGGGGRGF